MPVKVSYFVEGPDALLIEMAARSLCLNSGGNCYGGKSCGKREKCRMEGWTSYVDEVELVLSVVREKHTISAALNPVIAPVDEMEDRAL